MQVRGEANVGVARIEGRQCEIRPCASGGSRRCLDAARAVFSYLGPVLKKHCGPHRHQRIGERR